MQGLLDSLKREQRKMVKEMQASHQATLRAVREENRQEVKRLEASADAQVHANACPYCCSISSLTMHITRGQQAPERLGVGRAQSTRKSPDTRYERVAAVLRHKAKASRSAAVAICLDCGGLISVAVVVSRHIPMQKACQPMMPAEGG